MRGRVASRIISGQDVCIFCAFRPAYNTAVRSKRHSRTIRDYSSTTVVHSPAGTAQAPKNDEEDEGELPPMLRQNASLAKGFPSQRSNAPPPPSPPSPFPARAREPPRDSSFSSSFSSPRSNFRPTDRSQNTRDEPPSRETNFRPMVQQDQNGRFDRFQGNGMGRRDDRRPFADEEQAQRGERQPNIRFSFGREMNEDRRPPFEERSNVRRFPRESRYESNGNENQARTTTGRWGGFADDSLPPINRGARQRDMSERSIFGRDSWSERNNRDFDTRRTSQRDAGRFGQQDQRADNAISHPEVEVETEGSATSVAEPRVTPIIEPQDEFSGFHHRRGQREDKRKSRSSRYEYEEDGDTETSAAMPAPTISKSAPLRRSQSSHAGNFDLEMAEAEEKLYGSQDRYKKKGKKQKVVEVVKAKPSIKISEFLSVSQLAKALSVPLESFIQKLEEEGFEGARYDHILDSQTSSMFADLYGFEPIVATEDTATDLVARPPPEDISVLPPRPPIVTIMGHVDHGKTTILDYLRKSSVVATEHGGITQHIGAFSVTMPGTNRQITFLDTPGHAAFLEMRRRGANVTDIVVLVVAADDSVKPQTIEAIKHAKEANVQVIVAINKVDKQDADIERVKQDLTRHEIVVEDYGGDYQAIPVSGKTGQGMADLEEAIITLADVYDYRAEVDGPVEGTIIESSVTAGGRVATVLVRRGTLRIGDFIVAGSTWARVRTLHNDTGALVTEAPPGTPVQVGGWRGEDPTAGLEVLQAENEDQAKEVVDFRIEKRESLRSSVDMVAINESRSEEAEARAKVLEWEAQQEWAKRSHGRRPKDNTGWVERDSSDGPQQVHFVIKADVAGSVEAVVAAVSAVGNNDIKANVIHSGTGQLTESDIRMLATSGETGYAISFNQPIDGTMYRLAESAGLQILDHNIIYKVTDEVKEKLIEELPPIVTQKVMGEAEVGQTFEITVKKNKIKIAGCRVTNGTISRANKVRVLRDGEVVYTGTLHSLKNVKKDVTEMRKGTECGMGFENWEDFQEGDQIQCFEEHKEKRTLY